ncbi:short-chain dehydrogenase [Dokdonia pacifica]|uniref:NAD(P)-dependent dehydrogenase, short-chain alcohol dehydrogenase family n=1 Tax=Dokdonia pacifica TaxID=1627892 RepID=A0A239DTZ3_9FLAO|nr:SDR family oxidoreductase [Dokdonia pacifica]GGG41022.1 short-chain dehydrogenase [Dokdonia pacifica]SNS35378.1 NAD(P)-dependent dehydrogenase, short-chain alcohol dehydrogenase family [Dokdonia pacifica]
MTTQQDYIGKWAVILGGSSGLGLATAQKLAKEGMHICIVHRSRRSVLAVFEEAMKEMKLSGVQVIAFNTDALNAEKRTQVVSELLEIVGTSQVKSLIHSVARGNLKPLYSEEGTVLSNDDFMRTVDAMAISLYDWVSAFAKANLFSPDARVIAFTSEGSRKAWKQYGAVAVAKAALESITRSIALEFAPVHIKANCIQAGVTDTESLRLIPGSDVMKEKSIERNPYGRLTLPEDVANAVYLLCRDEASWINGAVVPVDGGDHIR